MQMLSLFSLRLKPPALIALMFGIDFEEPCNAVGTAGQTGSRAGGQTSQTELVRTCPGWWGWGTVSLWVEGNCQEDQRDLW